MLNSLMNQNRLIKLANEIAALNPGDAPRRTLFLTNRSFIALAIAVALNLMTLAGVPAPAFLTALAPEMLAEHLVSLATALLALWGVTERKAGASRAIWNTGQAVKAIEEAAGISKLDKDELTERLRQAWAILP